MSYKINKVHVMYNENKISELALVWQSNPVGWVRATYINTKPCSGYGFIEPHYTLNPKLIQEAARFGWNLPDNKKQHYFPGERP